jgi:hypothetical protein
MISLKGMPASFISITLATHMFALSCPETSMRRMRRCAFGVGGDDELHEWSVDLFRLTAGRWPWEPADRKRENDW